MEQFEAMIQKDDAGRLTFFEIPFNAKERFCKPKGTIYVSGMINGVQYRGRLLSRGGGKFLMVLDKALQKAIGFDGRAMTAHITMSSEELEPAGKKQEEPAGLSSGMDVLTAIKTRQSICPITVLLKPMSYFSILRIKCDANKCISCGKCKRICPMNVDVTDNSRNRENGTECILCLECVSHCPRDAL